MHTDSFYGLGRRLVSHWKVLSSPRAWEPELYFTLQVKWSLKSKWQYSGQGAFACSLQRLTRKTTNICNKQHYIKINVNLKKLIKNYITQGLTMK